MLRLIDDKTGRTKTFYVQYDIDCFTHSYDEEFLHEMVCSLLYERMCYKRGFKEQWDDGTDMEASDWVRCVTVLYDKLS